MLQLFQFSWPECCRKTGRNHQGGTYAEDTNRCHACHGRAYWLDYLRANVANRTGFADDIDGLRVSGEGRPGPSAQSQPNELDCSKTTSLLRFHRPRRRSRQARLERAVRRLTQLYKLEKIADSELKAMVGKRVEVTGRIDAEANDTTGQPPSSAQTNKTDKVIGHDRINLPEFEVTSIRAVSGTCPAKPTTSK